VAVQILAPQLSKSSFPRHRIFGRTKCTGVLALLHTLVWRNGRHCRDVLVNIGYRLRSRSPTILYKQRHGVLAWIEVPSG
jgi:hypothetical protein